MEFNHYSVLLNETIDNLNIRPDGIYADGTLGGAGHSSVIAGRLEKGHLYGFDQDMDAIAAATERLAYYGDKVTIIHSNYENMVRKLQERGVTGVDGVLLDLGVSSFQLDTPERGFSYMAKDAYLDMRMDQQGGLTAADIINTYSGDELCRILWDYGEERYAKNIVAGIIREREKKPIETAGELNRIIEAAVPKKNQIKNGHPAKRTYQALRISLNRELEVLEDSLDGMIDFLNPGGRICIITFHSLEDRIVKNIFKKNENPCTCPKNFPVCVCGNKSKGRVITRKPILPSEQELEENTRSRSAKLRVFEKVV